MASTETKQENPSKDSDAKKKGKGKFMKPRPKPFVPNEMPKQEEAPVNAAEIWEQYPELAASVGVRQVNLDRKKETARKTMKTWLPLFLASLAADRDVSKACRKIRVPRAFVYQFRNENPIFKQAWDDAVTACIDSVEAEVIKRARDGVLEPVFQGGHLVGFVYKKSDTLAGLVLRAHRQELYNVNKTELTGKEGGPLQIQPVVILPPALDEPAPEPEPEKPTT